MKRLLLTVGMLLALPGPASAVAASHPCGGLTNKGSKATHIRATNTTCRAARSVVRAFQNTYGCYIAYECQALNYTCARGGNGYTSTVVCRRGAGRRVVWRDGLDTSGTPG